MSIIAGEECAVNVGSWTRATCLREPNSSGRICAEWKTRGPAPVLTDGAGQPIPVPEGVRTTQLVNWDGFTPGTGPMQYLTLDAFYEQFPDVPLNEI